MNEIILTKEADVLICAIYAEYLRRRKNGVNKTQATKNFSSEKIKSDLLPEWQLEDIDDTMSELHKNTLVGCLNADNFTAYDGWITSEGILYMEGRFERKLSKIIDYVSKISNIAFNFLK